MTYDFMQKRGLTNLLWAYSPGSEPKNQDEYFERYPGDDIVDVLGFDTYIGKTLKGTRRIFGSAFAGITTEAYVRLNMLLVFGKR